MRFDYFKLIDTIEHLDVKAMKVVASARVPDESTVFEGHFPGYPLMPGVLLIEAMAQASGYLILAVNNFTKMPYLAGVREAKLRSFVEPSTELVVETAIEHEGSGYAITSSQILRDGRRICNAQLTMSVGKFPVPELEGYVRKRAKEMGLEPT
jgi:3-hydroxyacyl-[acyl-carrier-protein] dehydratase